MSTCGENEVCIGPFVTGEKPVPLEYQFLQSNGTTPLTDLTGYGVRFIWRERDGVSITRNGSVSNGPLAKVQYPWQGDEFPTPGSYIAEFWIGNAGGVKYASVKIVWDVRASVGPVPAI